MDLIPRVIASAEEACQAAEAITAHMWDGQITSLIFQISLQTELCGIKMFVSLHNKKLSHFYNRAVLQEDKRLKRQQEEALHLSVSEELVL